MRLLVFSLVLLSFVVSACGTAPTTMVECTDDACFFEALDTCAEATYTKDSSIEMFGNMIDSTVDLEILSDCTVDVVLRDYVMSPSPMLLEAMAESDEMHDIEGNVIEDVNEVYAPLNEQIRVAFGTKANCDVADSMITPDQLAVVFMDDSVCTGELTDFFAEDFA